MEKVWEELKKVEAQAEKIRREAQSKAKEITNLSLQEAEKLVANSKTYAKEEAEQLYADRISQANHRRDEQLKANQQAMDQLKKQAEKHMEQASGHIVDAVLGDNIT
jgi:vacuolar-type H+-ATPase subunit E/Vma4